MLAITMWQPWASLWLGPKQNETRPWRTHYLGWLGVHAGKRKPDKPGELSEELEEACKIQFGLNWRSLLPRGKLIGAVNVIDCAPVEQVWQNVKGTPEAALGNYSPNEGRFIIRRNSALKLPTPIPMNGGRKFFSLDDTITREIEDIIVDRTMHGWNYIQQRRFDNAAKALGYDTHSD